MKILMPVCLFSILFILPCRSQTEAIRWYFGEGAGMHFMNAQPELLNDGKLNTLEGCAVICDNLKGDLLFYTDGVTVWNKNHEIMKNGTGLKGAPSSTQSALIVPNPQNEKEYYIFTAPSRTDNPMPADLYYSIVSLSDPNGEVVKKNVLLYGSVGEKLTGIRECSIGGFWIITHHVKEAKFYAFQLTIYGLDTKPVISTFPNMYSGAYAGYLKVSPDGKRIATGMGVFNKPNVLCLFDFDNVTGKVSNRRVIDSALENPTSWFYGVSFSPNNTKLYATSELGILQYDITKTNASEIRASRDTISKKAVIGALQIAPNGKIYVSPFGGDKKLGVIRNPNAKGIVCDYTENGPEVKCTYGLPNFMDHIFSYDYSPFTLCLNYYGRLDTVRTCPGTPVTITHRLSKGAMDRQWEVENAVVKVRNDSTIQCVINKMGVHKVRLIYRYKTLLDTMYTAIVVAMPKVYAGDDAFFCQDTIPIYYRLGSTPIKGYKYSWSPADGLSNPNIANPNLRVTKTQKYIVRVTDSLGCGTSDTVLINFNKSIVPKVIGNTVICPGTSTALVVTGGETYQWFPGSGLSDSTIANPIVTPKQTTKYKIVIKLSNCVDSMFLTVVVKERPQIVATSTTICEGQAIQLYTSGGKSYRWVPGEGLNDSTIANPIARPTKTTEYKVYVFTESCIDSASVTISVKPSPKANAGVDRTICSGTSIRLGTQRVEGNTYTWNPKTYLDSSSIADPLCTPFTSIKYILTVRSSNNCISYDTVTVTVNRSLHIKTNRDTSICLGDSIQLESMGAEKYSWYPATGLDNPNFPNPIAKPLKPTMYYVTGTIGECAGMDSVFVDIQNPPKLSISPIKPICKGDSTILRVSGAEQYFWSPSEGLQTTNASVSIAHPQRTTMYYVRGRVGKCESFDSVLVHVIAKPVIKVSGSSTMCKGDTIPISVTGAENYTWSPKEFISNPFAATTYLFPEQSTMFKVIGESNGCYTEDSILVTVLEPPTLVVNADTSICSGDSMRLFVTGADSYRWSPVTGLDNPLSPTPSAKPLSTTTYTVYGTRNGCMDSAEVLIDVRNSKHYVLHTSVKGQNVHKVGTIIPISIEIPSGIYKITFSLQFDDCCLFYTGTFRQKNKGVVYVQNNKDMIQITVDSIRGNGEEITLEFILLLPPDGRLSETIGIYNVNVYQDCANVEAGREIKVQYDPSCAWSIRGVLGTEKFDVVADGEKVHIYTGIGGRTKLSIYDMRGEEVWQMENNYSQSSEVEIPFPELPKGVFIIRVQNYTYKKDIVIYR